jgi:hypothetical protein
MVPVNINRLLSLNNRLTFRLIIYPLSWSVVKRIGAEFYVGSLSKRNALRIRQATKHGSFTTVIK